MSEERPGPGSQEGDLTRPVSAPGRSGSDPGVVRRFFWLFSSPGRVFQPPRSRAMWVIPLVVLSLMQIGQTVLLRDLYMDRMRHNIESNESIPEEQKARILEGLDQGDVGTGALAMQAAGGLVGFWLIGFILPVLLYLIALNFVLGAKAGFREVFTVTAFSGLIVLVREVLRTPIMLARRSTDVYTSPAALLSDPSPAALAALNFFDLFELYRLVVITFGFAVICALPPRRAALPAVAVWILYGLATVGCALTPLGQYMR